jgi:hypothetical protein
MKKTAGIALLAILAEHAECQPEIYGKPTISEKTIEAVLKINGSPAEGIGDKVCEMSEKYKVDTAFLLAVFGKESDYGREGIASKTKSWSNMRPGPQWKGKVYDAGGKKGKFRQYDSFEQSLENFCRHLQLNYPQTTTIREWAPKHAPAEDRNDPQDFISDMIKKIGVYQDIESRRTVPVQHEGSWLFIPGPKWKQIAEGRAYIVKTGDTLTGISKKCRTSEARLKALNGLKGNYLKSGQYLKTR